MKPLYWMLLGLVAWLALAAIGLRWVLRPYWWAMRPCLGGPCGMAAVRSEFYFHLAPFPEAGAVRLPDDEEFFDAEEELVRSWIWRETLRRFLVGFTLWMASGWFVHWFTSRIIYGPQRWRGRWQ